MKKIYIGLIGLILLHFFILVCVSFTAWPEMLSYPYLLNKGFVLYKDFVHPYPPLLTIILSTLYKYFGYNQNTLKLFTWFLIITNDILIFKIIKKTSGKNLLTLSLLAVYVLTQPFLEGNQLWFDLAITTPVLAAIWFLVQDKKYRNILFAGIFLGFAALTKQTVGLFITAGLVYMTFIRKSIKDALIFILGPLCLAIILGIYLVVNNSLGEFLSWNLIYPFTYWSHFPGYIQMGISNNQMLILGVLLFPLFVLLAQNYKTILKDKVYVLLWIFFVLSLVMTYPRFSFFHFQLALALIIVNTGYLIGKFKISPLIIAMTGMLVIFTITIPGIKRNLVPETRFWEKSDVVFAQNIRDLVKGESVYMIGQPSSLYVFSGLVPAKPWLDNYVWYFEIPGVQSQTLTRWNSNPPKFIVWQEPNQGEWYELGAYQPKEIKKWIEDHYNYKLLIRKGVSVWQRKD